jgi:hypothetical protein
MPMVRKGGKVKHFPYTKAGKAAAKSYASKGNGKTADKKKKKNGY